MQNRLIKLVKYIWLLPTFFLCLWILNSHFKTTGCFGLVEVLGAFFKHGILILILILTSLIQVIVMVEKKAYITHSIILCLCFLFLIGTYFLLKLPSDYFKSEQLLKAELIDFRKGEIILRKDNSFLATEIYTDWSCAYEGEYKQEGNMIYLSPYINELTHGLFEDTYRIQQNHYLIPYQDTSMVMDSLRWLRII